MRRQPETVRAFLLRTTALYSGIVKAPLAETQNSTFSIYYKSKRQQRMELRH